MTEKKQLSTVEDRILTGVREAYGEILTDEEVASLVKSAYTKLMDRNVTSLNVRVKDPLYSTNKERPLTKTLFSVPLESPVSRIEATAMEEILSKFYVETCNRISELASPEMIDEYGMHAANESIVKIMEEHSSKIFASFVGSMASMVAQNAVNSLPGLIKVVL